MPVGIQDFDGEFIVCSSVARKIAEDEVVGAPTAVEMFTVFEKPVLTVARQAKRSSLTEQAASSARAARERVRCLNMIVKF